MIIAMEGIPGSGKSTSGTLLAERLNTAGLSGTFHHESRPQPLVGLPWGHDSAVETVRSTTVDAYPVTSWSRVVPAGDDFIVMDGRLLQHTGCFSMLRGDARCDADALVAAVMSAVTEDLRVVHLGTTAPEEALWATMLARRESHPTWEPFVVALFESMPWCASRGLRGPEAFVAAMVHWDHWQRSILSTLPCPTLILDDPAEDWQATLDAIEAFVSRPVGTRRGLPTR